MLATMPGLFRFVDAEHRANTRTALRLKHTHGDVTIEVHNSCLLGGIELAVLQALTAMATVDGETLAPDIAGALTPVEQTLLDALAVQPGAVPAAFEVDLDAVQPVTADVRHLAFADMHLREVIGLPDGKPYRDIVEQAIRNLATVVLLVYPTRTSKAVQCYHLLAQLHTDTGSRRLHRTHVALNPRLTQFVLGNMPQETRISLKETRQLGTDQVARILHQRLCALINDGKGRSVSYRTLLEYVYPDDAEARQADNLRRLEDRAFARIKPRDLQAQRMNTVLDALSKLITKLEWSGELVSDQHARIAANLRVPLAANPSDDPDAHAQNRERMAREHDDQAQAAAARAARDPMDTVLYIERKKVFARVAKALSAR